MKLAMIDQSFHWPPTGGSWVDLRETAIRLAEFGISCKIFVPEWERWNIPGGRINMDPGVPVEVIPIQSRQFNFWSLPRILKSRVMKWNPDLIMLGNTFYLAPYIIRQFPTIPVILRVYAHELICLNYMNLFKGNVFRWDKENPRGDICPGNTLATPFQCWACGLRRMGGTLIGPRLNPVAIEYWSSLAFLPTYHRTIRNSLNSLKAIMVYNPFIKSLLQPLRTPVHVVPAGIDTRRFSPADHREAGPVRILLTGRLDDQRKGYQSFRECINILLSRGLNIQAWITDSRPGQQDDIIRNAGWITWDKLPELYRSMDIVVCPSIWPEPFGITALEAMATALPVAASRIGGFLSTVVDGETGFHFSPGDPVEMSDRLEEMIRNPELRERMGRAGRERVLEHYEWSSIVERYTLPILRG